MAAERIHGVGRADGYGSVHGKATTRDAVPLGTQRGLSVVMIRLMPEELVHPRKVADERSLAGFGCRHAIDSAEKLSTAWPIGRHSILHYV